MTRVPDNPQLRQRPRFAAIHLALRHGTTPSDDCRRVKGRECNSPTAVETLRVPCVTGVYIGPIDCATQHSRKRLSASPIADVLCPPSTLTEPSRALPPR
jgi:hypothetical protein